MPGLGEMAADSVTAEVEVAASDAEAVVFG